MRNYDVDAEAEVSGGSYEDRVNDLVNEYIDAAKGDLAIAAENLTADARRRGDAIDYGAHLLLSRKLATARERSI